LDGARQALSKARVKLWAKIPDHGSGSRIREARYRRESVSYWRQVIAVSAARQRAQAGDATAARRLAWRDQVIKARQRTTWLLKRLQSHEARAAKFDAECCGPCAYQFARARRNRSDLLEAIAAMAGEATTYAHYRGQLAAATVEAEPWLRRQLDAL